MYDYIKGELISKNAPNIVVECGNIGYLILSNVRVVADLPEVGEQVKIYTKLIHKEDYMGLTGFLHKEDRVIFDLLTTVSGVGTKVALTILDEFRTTELIAAVIEGDFKQISRAKGVGPKMAQKIILELKDKLTSSTTTAQIAASRVHKGAGSVVTHATIEEVQTILNSLGYTHNEVTNALELALKAAVKDDAQELLRSVLSIISEG